MTRVAHVYGRTTEVYVWWCWWVVSWVVSWVIFIDRPADGGDPGSSKILTHAA